MEHSEDRRLENNSKEESKIVKKDDIDNKTPG